MMSGGGVLLRGAVLWAALLLPAVGQPGKKAPAWPRQQVYALVDRYFAATEDAEKVKALEELKPIDEIPPAEAKRLVDYCLKKVLSTGPRLSSSGGVFEHPKYKGRYLVTAANGGRAGIVVGLHGGPGPDGSEAAKKFGSMCKSGLVGIWPTVLQQKYAEWGSNPDEERYVMELIRAARRTFQIDNNRCYLIGGSMGGYGTWHIGGHNADHFAAISSHAGGILGGESKKWGGGIVANLKNTGAFFTHGALDQPAPVDADRMASKALEELKKQYGPYDFKYIEYPDKGHTVVAKDLQEAMDWCVAKKRNPNPKLVIWEPLRPWKRCFNWLRVEVPEDGPRMVARIQGNEVTVESGGAKGLSILLNDKLVSLSKPVRVRVDGKEIYNDVCRGSAIAVVESVDERMDAESACWARVAVP